MKKKLFFVIAVIIIAFTSCNDPVEYPDIALLPGKWENNSYYECYYEDGTAKFWDLNDDYDEDEAIPFTWTLENDVLIQYHATTYGTIIPKTYTITELTESSLVYSDDYGVTHSFVRIN